MKLIICVLMAGVLMGCSKKPESIPDYQLPKNFAYIIHLKESNYQVGIATHGMECMQYSRGDVKIMIEVKDGLFFIKDVKDRVQ